MSITAPYNFVPLNQEVFFPNWAEQVSHDIPFSDGESGEIDITIEAKSPIFIRNHSKDKEKPSTEFCHFVDKNGAKQYYIPGSSVKGSIRTIFEVLSFSKLKLQDKRLSFRDLKHPSYKKKAMDQNKVYMGWLYKKNDNWIIQSLGKVTNGKTRIHYNEMKTYLDEKIIGKIKREKEAYKKYAHVEIDKLETKSGTIVFTGSTGNKTREFIFPNSKIENTFSFTENDAVIQTFKDAYYIQTPNESEDWKNLWKERFRQGQKVPVFFQLDDNGKIKHFGLSMLYKLPYENTLQELLEKYQNYKDAPDFAETVFGYVKGTKALKGRVQFSHFVNDNSVKLSKPVLLPLSSPRPTFYPNYLVQCKNERFPQTYDNQNSILRGFKFYPPNSNITTFDPLCKKNKNMCTSFTPLQKGSSFRGKIRFFNLKTVELGALLSSLTFLNSNQDRYFHKIGMGKPYGYGTVKIKIRSIKTDTSKDISHYVDQFICLMNKQLQKDYVETPQISALLKLHQYGSTQNLTYPKNIKDFIDAKKRNYFLSEVVENGYNKNKLCKQKNKKQKSKSTGVTTLKKKFQE